MPHHLVTIISIHRDIKTTHCLTKFHEHLKVDVLSTLITRIYCSHFHIIDRPPGVGQYNIGTNILPKFHDDLSIIVASKFLIRLILMTDFARQTTEKGDHKS
ncbi:hypothetical protein DPMN_028032 [Dreissena polymorpha]|uniref:Uncharacterized protein n=1 Tax=Dreissena polymorpha TaxID=45954 RepID=A0A9D4LUN0_DREPO|nr:hypothetical protein DPMN_028032 [Dreissena polymorpha]